MKRLRWLLPPIIFGLLLTVAVSTIASRATPQFIPQSVNTGQHFLPPYGEPRDRFGFDSGPLSGYDVAQLHAGWYSNWSASLDPLHPDQLVYVQLIVLQSGANPHDPSQVTTQPGPAAIAQIAAAHPGTLWLVGNEPDSIYQGAPILPEVYAVVYHDLYQYIKGLDPAALIANGGIVQVTPCRLEYLDIVWDTYLSTYSEPLPVDVWNIHAFILREVYSSWGASTPPGVDPGCGIDYAVDDADDMTIFWDNVRAMRAWMKDKGYQDSPLIISEYGILWPQWFAPQYTSARVSQFMTQTFDLFLYATDDDLGYPADDFRLVQAWAWYSLSDDEFYNGYLFHGEDKTLSPMGQAYGAYTAALTGTGYVDLSAQLVTARPVFTSAVGQAGSSGLVTFSVAVTGSIANLGRLPVPDALARLELVPLEGGDAGFVYDAFYAVPGRFEGVVGLPPLTATLRAADRYELRLSLDPENQLDEPREWNNVATATMDLRPDLVPLTLTYRLDGSGLQSGTLALTATIRNQGSWPSTAVSATVYLETVPERTLEVPEVFSVPPLAVDGKVSIQATLDWPLPDHDLYHLVLELDEGDGLPEQNEDNNRRAQVVAVDLSTTLSPTATTVLTSASGAVQLVFPVGVVVAPTQVRYKPLLLGDADVHGLRSSGVAFLLTAVVDSQPAPLTFAQPVAVTWRYSDANVSALEEARLRLFALGEGGLWRDAACQPYQRDLDGNRLTTAICHTGQFAFGNQYTLYLPFIPREMPALNSNQAPSPPTPQPGRPGSPLRLP
jgi:hypothetical protein